MIQNRRIASTILVALAGIVISGCAGSKHDKDRPAWIDKGSGFYPGDYGKAFYGVGGASGIANVQMRRTVAETNSRADLARSFKTHIQDLVKVYSRHISGYARANGISEEQLAQQTTRAFTEMELVGAVIVDRYFDSKEETQYALVRMNVSEFKDSIERMKELGKEAREVIQMNSQKAFEELEHEAAKRSN